MRQRCVAAGRTLHAAFIGELKCGYASDKMVTNVSSQRLANEISRDLQTLGACPVTAAVSIAVDLLAC